MADVRRPISLLVLALATAAHAAVPAAPTALAAVGISSSAIRLDWRDASGDEDGFRIERSLDGHRWQEIGHVGRDGTSYDDTALPPATLHLYRVRAVNGHGASPVGEWNYASTRALVSTSPTRSADLVARAGVAGEVLLRWSDVFDDESGWVIERTPDGSESWSEVAWAGVGQTEHVDRGLAWGAAYRYRIRAANGGWSAGAGSQVQTATGAVTAPYGLGAAGATTSRIDLWWGDGSDGETGFVIERSWDGDSFQPIATVGADVTAWSHHGVFADVTYAYRVRALSAGGPSSPSNTAGAVARAFSGAIAAPSGLRAVFASGTTSLSWTDASADETGFRVERGDMSGLHFTEVAVLPAGSTSFASGYASHWRVQAIGASGDSRYAHATVEFAGSTPYEPTYPGGAAPIGSTWAPEPGAIAASGQPVSVETRQHPQFAELVVIGSDANDAITVAQSGGSLIVSVAGRGPVPVAGPIASIVVDGRGGDDAIEIAAGVTALARLIGGEGDDQLRARGAGRATLVAIGAGNDWLSGNGADTAYWCDQDGIDAVQASAREVAARRIHRVAAFHQYFSEDPGHPDHVSKQVGLRIREPLGYFGGASYAGASLWGAIPSMLDVNQGSVQDCPITSYLQGLAHQVPDALRDVAVDLGDGTYALRLGPPDAPGYVRVDDDFTPAHARPGRSGAVWALVLEKVIYGHFQADGLTAMESLLHLPTSGEDQAFEQIRAGLAQRRILGYGTPGEQALGAPLVAQDHAYTIVGAYRDGAGRARFILRNPYGIMKDLRGRPDNELGLVTLSWDQLRTNGRQVTFQRFLGAEDPTPNQEPVARIIADPTVGAAPLAVSFGGGSSSDADGAIVAYAWEFGDGATAAGRGVTHAYGAGDWTATLTVTDDDGASHATAIAISAWSTPGDQAPTARLSASTTSGVAPLAVSFDGTASSDADGWIAWHHWDFGDGGSASGAYASHAYASPGTYVATLTVWDDDGASASAATTITVTPGGQVGDGTGLSGAYFHDAALSEPALTRSDARVDFDWGGGSPDGSIDGDTFSARWTG
ncbi:MAG TPA: PKD domain-containing protein, partial [Planctomycetota bacterium]|nr:PKD domain-containing protein [Planctomycetota bacterium]